MNKLSNKGQSLAMFVIFIPFIILFCAFIIDYGIAKYNYNKLNNISLMVIRYGIKNIDNDPYNDMVDLLYKNDEDINDYKINIDTSNKKINLSVTKASDSFFGRIINKDYFKETIKYTGYYKDERIVIEEGIK